jgi:hypothetical protein
MRTLHPRSRIAIGLDLGAQLDPVSQFRDPWDCRQNAVQAAAGIEAQRVTSQTMRLFMSENSTHLQWRERIEKARTDIDSWSPEPNTGREWARVGYYK